MSPRGRDCRVELNYWRFRAAVTPSDGKTFAIGPASLASPPDSREPWSTACEQCIIDTAPLTVTGHRR
jgi:hypothetical protein